MRHHLNRLLRRYTPMTLYTAGAIDAILVASAIVLISVHLK